MDPARVYCNMTADSSTGEYFLIPSSVFINYELNDNLFTSDHQFYVKLINLGPVML